MRMPPSTISVWPVMKFDICEARNSTASATSRPVPMRAIVSSRSRYTCFDCDWSSDVCSSDLRKIEVYPSRAVLQTSITVSLVGGYLFVIGVLAQIVASYGGATSFQLQAFLVLVAIALLAVF